MSIASLMPNHGRQAAEPAGRAAICVLAIVASLAPAAVPRSTAAGDATVAALVDGHPIFAAEIERELATVVRGRSMDPAGLADLRRQILRQLIDRRLVLEYLADAGLAASQAELEREVRRLQKRAEQQGIAWGEFLQQSGRSEAQLQQQLAWRIGWARFLESHATDQNLQRYFQQHRREFDGSRLRVAHLLLPIEAADDAAAVGEVVHRVQQIRQQILAGQLTFAEAASRFSQAPTAASGGEIGFIGRAGPMPEAFSAAAFALDPGQLSEPVIGPFGVHLIQCLEIEPGNKTWEDVRGELVQAVTRHLFRWAAERQRPQAVIQRE